MAFGRYRGEELRTNVSPASVASLGCAKCLIFLILFFIFAGGIMTGLSRSNPPGDVIKTIGPVCLGIGFFFLVASITLCIVAACLTKKLEEKRLQQQEHPEQTLTAEVPHKPLTASAYPHQQAFENVDLTASSYSTKPIDQFPPENYPLQPQSQYPPQPPNYYSPASSYVPPSGSPYPQSYPQTAPIINPENSQCISADNKSPLESMKQIT